MGLWKHSFLLVLLTNLSLGFHEENEIVGDPLVDCGEGHITISFDTQLPFKGIVFVREHLEQPECRSPPMDDQWIRNTSLRIKLTDCDTNRTLSQDPPGLFITTNIVVAFHPEFLTKHDRVYQVQCYYMTMEWKFMRQINISMPGPVLQTENVPMPVCKYEVLDGNPEGPPVYYAKVGQMVYHKWTCDTETTDTFCMIVHSCTVDDGEGNKVELIDQKGCAHDRYLLSNLEYVNDLQAGREAHVYKFADKQGIYYECQIAITVKEPDQEYCEVPVCEDPKRKRRSHVTVVNATEVIYQPNEYNSSSVEFMMAPSSLQDNIFMDSIMFDESEQMCVSPLALSVYGAVNAFIVILALFISVHSIREIKSSNKG